LMLGNSYLKRFFNVSHDAKDIRMALNAYNQAVRLIPDTFHWNPVDSNKIRMSLRIQMYFIIAPSCMTIWRTFNKLWMTL